MIVVARNRRDRVSLKTFSLLAVLPIVREFAYVYGMFLGFVRDERDQQDLMEREVNRSVHRHHREKY